MIIQIRINKQWALAAMCYQIAEDGEPLSQDEFLYYLRHYIQEFGRNCVEKHIEEALPAIYRLAVKAVKDFWHPSSMNSKN